MDRIAYTAVHGTWSFDGVPSPDEWNHPQSAFAQYLAGQGFVARPPFYWCGDVDGLAWPWRARAAHRLHREWMAAGLALGERLVRDAPSVVFAHSHGGNVALYAAAQGARIPVLVTVATPIRRDMREVAVAARASVATWFHVHSDGSDWMQALGEILDGHLGICRTAIWRADDGQVVAAADRSFGWPHVGHSSILCDPRAFHWWRDSGLIDSLRDTVVAAPQ